MTVASGREALKMDMLCRRRAMDLLRACWFMGGIMGGGVIAKENAGVVCLKVGKVDRLVMLAALRGESALPVEV